MKVAGMRVRIVILKEQVEVDGIGNHRNVWTPYHACYAAVSGEAGREVTEAGTVADDASLDLTVRWCEKTKALRSTQYRVSFKDEIYDIEAVDHMNYRNKTIKLKCRKVRR